MKSNPEIDCWLSRVEKIKSLFNIKRLCGTPERVGLVIDKAIKSKFDRFYLDEINMIKLGDDGQDHNKLRFYNKFKGSFRIEPYILKIKNRNQRQWLTRFRTSAHTLRKESGRYTRPITPITERKCMYCDDEEIFFFARLPLGKVSPYLLSANRLYDQNNITFCWFDIISIRTITIKK